ncbi:hypothetical protein M758_7G073900 [Ceratodon purpureus]|nr:hypothetical protein M758_7G073900 [Ceratodon purpureus]
MQGISELFVLTHILPLRFIAPGYATREDLETPSNHLRLFDCPQWSYRLPYWLQRMQTRCDWTRRFANNL